MRSGGLERRQLVLAAIAAVTLFGAALYLVLGSDSGDSQPTVTEVGAVNASADAPADSSADSSSTAAPTEAPAEKPARRGGGDAQSASERSADDQGVDDQSADDTQLSTDPAGEHGDRPACSETASGCGTSQPGGNGGDADARGGAGRNAEPPVTEAAAPADIDSRGSGDEGTTRRDIRQSEAAESRNDPIDEEYLASPEAIDESTDAERSGPGGGGGGGN